LAFLAFATTYMARMAYPPLIPEMSIELNLTHAEAGMLMSGFFMGYLAIQLPIGFVSDKVGVKRIFTISLVLTGILCILTGFAGSFSEVLIYRFSKGLAAGCIFAPGSALILRWFPPKDRAISISFFQISVSFGTFIALSSSAAISSFFGGWSWSFWILGIPSIIIAVPSLFLLREKPDETFEGEVVDGGREVGSYYGFVLRDLRMWLVCIATVGGGAAFIGSLTWIPTYLVRIVNLSEVYAGSISSLLALAGIFGTPIGGFIADRILHKRSPIVFLGIFGSGLACIFFSIVVPSDLYSAIALFIPIPFFSAVWWIGPSLLSEWFPLKVLGTATGILNFMTISGCVLGPFIFGLILDLTNSFSHGWFALGAIASLSALLMIPIMLQDSKNV